MFVDKTEDHGSHWRTPPRDQICSWLSHMENELIKKQGQCGVSVVFRAERSSNSREISAGMEEGDCGGETCLYQMFVSNLTGTQVFNRMWTQPHRTGSGSREQCQGCEGSEGREPGLTAPALPLSTWLLVSCIADAVSLSYQQAPGLQLCLKG